MVSDSRIRASDGTATRPPPCASICPPAGPVSPFGPAGPCGDGGLGTSAELNQAIGVAANGSGNLLIAGAYNQRVQAVTG